MKNILVKVHSREVLEDDTDKDKLVNLLVELRKVYEEKKLENLSDKITVRELFWKSNFDNVFEILKSTFDVEEKNYEFYKQIFNTIKKTPVLESTGFLGFSKRTSEADVVFCYPYSSQFFSISLTPYKEIANCIVEPSTLEEHSSDFIVAAFLDEFSWEPSEDHKEDLTDELNEAVEESKGIKINLHDEDYEDESEEEEDIENDKVISFDKDNSDEVKTVSFDELFASSITEAYEKSIRELIKTVKFGDVKEVFIEFINHNYSYIYDFNKTDEEIIYLFEQSYFSIINKIKTHKPVNDLGYVSFETENALIYSSNSKHPFKDFKCVYSGENSLEVIDCKINEKFYDPEECVAFFIFCYLSEKFIPFSNRQLHFNDEVVGTKFNTYINKNFNSTLEDKKLDNLDELTFDEIYSLSFVIENYVSIYHFSFENYEEIMN